MITHDEPEMDVWQPLPERVPMARIVLWTLAVAVVLCALVALAWR